jgi:hypothetical protein
MRAMATFEYRVAIMDKTAFRFSAGKNLPIIYLSGLRMVRQLTKDLEYAQGLLADAAG